MDPTFELVRRANLTSSLADFSTYYAGKSPSYLATCKYLSAEARIAVFQRLIEERHWLLAIRVAHIILFGCRYHSDDMAHDAEG